VTLTCTLGGCTYHFFTVDLGQGNNEMLRICFQVQSMLWQQEGDVLGLELSKASEFFHNFYKFIYH